MKKNDLSLHFIHLSLTLLIPLLILAVGGCEEDKPRTNIDYGPESSAATVENALLEPLLNMDPLNIQPGEYVHFATTQEVGNTGTVSLLSETGQTVVSRQETDEAVVFTVIENKIDYGQTQPRKVTTEFEFAVAKSIQEMTQKLAPQPMMKTFASLGDSPLRTLAEALVHTTNARVTYHNLQRSVQNVPVPDGVRHRLNCLEFANCEIEVHRVSFDQVTWNPGTNGDKVRFEFTLSPHAPYLASLLNKCMTLLVPVENRHFLVRQCSPVVDFRFIE